MMWLYDLIVMIGVITLAITGLVAVAYNMSWRKKEMLCCVCSEPALDEYACANMKSVCVDCCDVCDHG